jgi:uncharacterized protein
VRQAPRPRRLNGQETRGTMSELIEAAKAGDQTRAREILAASPSAAPVANAAGETPVMAALYRGHQDLADEIGDAIVSAGGTLDVFAAAALGRVEALDAALTHPGAVNAYAYDGWTPLHLAAFFGRVEAVERLLAAGAALNAKSTNSMTNTPLHAAVAGGRTDVALLLVQRGAEVNAADSGRHTPLHIAAENGNAPVVEALLAAGADAHAVDAEDKTPLSRAAARNHAAIVDLLNLGGGVGTRCADRRIGEGGLVDCGFEERRLGNLVGISDLISDCQLVRVADYSA